MRAARQAPSDPRAHGATTKRAKVAEAADTEPRVQGHSRERKVRRSESSVPPEKSPSDGLRRPAHHFAAPCPPTVFPPRESPLPSVGLSPVGPPKRPSPCGCCTDEWVLCTRPVATRATLGCSRVARISPAPDRHRKTVVPAGRRRRGDRPTARAPGVHQRGAPLPENPNVEGSRRDRGRPRAPGHQHASVNPRRPSTAQETGNQRTRVASRT